MAFARMSSAIQPHTTRSSSSSADPQGHRRSTGRTGPTWYHFFMSSDTPGLTWDLIQQARARIQGRVHRTPVMTSHTLDSLSGAHLYFKCENFQNVGAFKARGATN